MNVHLKAFSLIKAASCESKDAPTAAHSAVSGEKSDFFAALLEGLLSAETSPEVKERETGREVVKELLQQCQGEPEWAPLLGLPEVDFYREGLAQLVAISLQRELNPLLEVDIAGKALPVEDLPHKGEGTAALQTRGVFLFPQGGGGGPKEPGVEPKIVTGIMQNGNENVALDFTGSIKSSFPPVAEGEQMSVATAAKQQQFLKQKRAEQLFAESYTVVAEESEPAKTSISISQVSPAMDIKGEVKGKDGQERRSLFSAAAEGRQEDPAVKLMLAAENDPDKKAAPVSSRGERTAGKETPPDPLSHNQLQNQRISLKTALTKETIGNSQESGSAAAQENRYPVFFEAGDEAPFMAGGGSKGAFDSKGVLYYPAPPAEQEYALKVMEQIAERLRYLNRAGQQELRLKLEPEFLGEVLIRVRRLKGVLSAEVITRHAVVKELLEGQLEALRQRFQQADIELGRFDVLLKDEGRGGGQDFPYTQKGLEDQIFPEAAGVQKGDSPGDLPGFSPELWEENGRVNYLV